MKVTLQDLVISGAHYGHLTRFWNPKMKPYIYGSYCSTHIINLEHTVKQLERVQGYLEELGTAGRTVLFVCTKPYATELIRAVATECAMPYVNYRWLSGLLTNFKTVRSSIERLATMEEEIAGGVLKELTKKEGIRYMLTKEKLERAIGGVRDMSEHPDAMFVIDAGRHRGCIMEANTLNIPVIGVVDTNHSPDGIDYVIPGNDDSRQATQLYLDVAKESLLRARKLREQSLVAEVAANGG